MSDANAFDLGKFIPGFDFLQKLVTDRPGARGAAAGLGNWVAPTVSVEELERRIKDLRAVQFWLEQNVVAVKATIQALEVQKMTLATLRGMNVSMTEVAKAFTMSTGGAISATAPAAAKEAPAQSSGWPYASAPAEAAAEPAEPPAAEPPAEPARRPRRAKPASRASGKATEAAAPAAGLADPVQWWGALTQQFQQIAASALREAGRAASEAAPSAEPATSSEAAGAGQARAEAPEAAPKPAARKKAPAKKARKTAKKTAAKRAAAKPAAKAAAKPAKKAAEPAPRSPLAGWPLPPAFKIGRR